MRLLTLKIDYTSSYCVYIKILIYNLRLNKINQNMVPFYQLYLCRLLMSFLMISYQMYISTLGNNVYTSLQNIYY